MHTTRLMGASQMIGEPTVFVLGAGAGDPYGFPTGARLRDEVCHDFKTQYLEWLKRTEPNTTRRQRAWERARDFCGAFDASNDPSIDFWLGRNPEFLEIGKLAIIFRILHAESKRHIRRRCEKSEFDWYQYLYQRLTSHLPTKADYARFAENPVNFVTFNYDRFLEHLLFESLTNGFHGIDQEAIRKTLSKRSIIHVYGHIGSLEWQDAKDGIRYGTPLEHVRPQELTKNLYVIQEERENPNLEKARALLAGCHRVFFLGFAYARENLDVLGIPEVLTRDHMIFGTALASSDKKIADIGRRFTMDPKGGTGANVRSSYVHIENCDCLELLKRYL